MSRLSTPRPAWSGPLQMVREWGQPVGRWLRVAGGVLWEIVVFPWRLRQRRLGVQLLTDNLLAGLISMLAIYAIVFAVLFGYIGSGLFFGDAWDIDTTIGEKARTVGLSLDPDTVIAATTGDAAARTAVQATLDRLIPSSPTASDDLGDQRSNLDGQLGDSRSLPPAMVLEDVAYALLVDPSGTIVASTNPDWAQPGGALDTVAFPPLIDAVGQTADAGGGPIPGMMGSPYALGYRDSVTAGAFPVLGPTGDIVGIVAVQGVPFDLSDYVSPSDLLLEVAQDEWRSVVVFSVLGFLITLPVVFWRARVVSRRVKGLAVAADAWATGDLERRALVSGVDEVGRLGEHFNIMRERLAATDRARKSFVANVSHDLRTPVAVIRGHLERLQTVPASQDSASPTGDLNGSPPAVRTDSPSTLVSIDQATIAVLHRETVALGRLIDDLFTLARLEETALPIELGPLDVAIPVEEAVQSLRHLAWSQSKVTVQSLIGPGLPLVMGDPNRIRQILNNLIYNALRHTPAGGLVILDAREVSGGNMVEISVMDTGLGIPPEKLPSIFERFYQGSDAGRSKGEGSGLGLHIVKQLVEAQAGTISVESSLGQGTVFRVRLPRAARGSRRVAEKGRS